MDLKSNKLVHVENLIMRINIINIDKGVMFSKFNKIYALSLITLKSVMLFEHINEIVDLK